jgi:UDP-glucose:(heptosyl)LPS alpha-1,3-glucosyltransferase
VLLAIEEAVLRDPTQVILCNSEMVRSELATRYAIAAERLHVIVNGVDGQRFSPDHRAARREPVRAMLGAGDATAWLLVGSGFERKGVATAIGALARLDDVRTELWIAGAGDPRPYLHQAERLRVRDRVRFVGQRDDLPDLYAAADGFVLPTRYDACANACLEAAASGLPVVTSASNGAAGWLGTAGVTIDDADDVAGFAAALERLAEPGARDALGRAARARAERASWQQHVSELRALYRQLMAAR